jgi:hypothetical protein
MFNGGAFWLRHRPGFAIYPAIMITESRPSCLLGAGRMQSLFQSYQDNSLALCSCIYDVGLQALISRVNHDIYN